MWSTATIEDIRKDAGRTARRQHKTPQPVEIALEHYRLKGTWNFPFLGDYVPKGWVLCENIEPLFVDATGLDDRGPALSQKEFVVRVENFIKAQDHYALAILETGPAQAVIGVYQPDPRDFTHSGQLTERELRQVGGRR